MLTGCGCSRGVSVRPTSLLRSGEQATQTVEPVPETKTPKSLVTRMQSQSDGEPLPGQIRPSGIQTGQNEIVERSDTAGLDPKCASTRCPSPQQRTVAVRGQCKTSVAFSGGAVARDALIRNGHGFLVPPGGKQEIGQAVMRPSSDRGDAADLLTMLDHVLQQHACIVQPPRGEQRLSQSEHRRAM